MWRLNISIAVAFLFCIGTALSSAPTQALDMKEGKWEHTMEMKMEGMPGAPAMPFTNIQCMTQKDLVPQSADKDANCTTLEQKITGNKVVWKAKCVEKGSVTESEGEITYSGTTYSGTQKMKTTEKSGQVINTTMKVKGRRIGDCN